MHGKRESAPEGIAKQNVREHLRADVAKRLEHACEHWSREDFEDVVDKITDISLKYLPTAARQPE